MNTPIVYDYKGSKISFANGKNVMVNATEMAKSFDKRPAKWLELPSTKEFLSTLTDVRKSDFALIQTEKGGINGGGGTWMHEDVALEFARWLSPAFAIWCNDRIKELLKYGMTATQPTLDEMLDNPGLVIRMATQLKQERAEKARLEAESKQKDNQIKKLQPKAAFAEKAFDMKDKVDVGMAAKILNLGFGRNTLFKNLRETGVFFASKNEPKQRFVDAKYFEMTEHPIYDNNGELIKVVAKVLVTQKGLAYINHLFGGRMTEPQLVTIK
ncbi:KilA-N domain protein [Hallella bergensis DSM 17361]|uniref:KilA-N domain protein n=1 Tax=Hallella bergensis DSM 17361 TaxID=585502 RepID=D1Q0B9_9BACT|nr:phage antirepressor KilAC domain-containing protein [Hallella bergensis]EFA42904.1 KilA-N domain protein [Hallella bergensis DSM 17361]